MKIIFLVLVITTTTITTAFAQPLLIKYFHKLPTSDRQGFSIVKKGSTYSAYSSTGTCRLQLMETNGYLEIVDSGTGGGTLHYQLALFKNNKGYTIAVNYYTQGDVNENGTIHFYDGNNMNNITSKVVPSITALVQKTQANITANEMAEFTGDKPYYYFTLPIKGTTVIFNYGTNLLDIECNTGNQKACTIKKQLQPALLNWHYNTSTLTL
ncbi:hypothetical protein ACFOWM_07890 [Ferruginibacter yonginensis]|uniref:Uncharacterized protein n=1 Tax=Ferruginibacter yonginensis TaxID=1310416 RepID=A0ABV8QSR0_9BACT